MKTEYVHSEHQLTRALHEFVLTTFREHFGEEAIIRVDVMPFVIECWFTVQVTQETQPMRDLARRLEHELREDGGVPVAIFVQQSWKNRLAQLIKEVVSRPFAG